MPSWGPKYWMGICDIFRVRRTCLRTIPLLQNSKESLEITMDMIFAQSKDVCS